MTKKQLKRLKDKEEAEARAKAATIAGDESEDDTATTQIYNQINPNLVERTTIFSIYCHN
jgi:hypothetical protein